MPNSSDKDFRGFELSDGAVMYRILPETGECDRLDPNTLVFFLGASEHPGCRAPEVKRGAESFQLRPVTILSPEKELSPFSHFGARIERVLGVSRTTHCHSNGFIHSPMVGNVAVPRPRRQGQG